MGCPVEFFTFDKNYVERLLNGDPATEQHFVAYFDQLLRIKLRPRMLNPDQVEDLRQETFIRVIANLRKGGGIRQPERFAAFVNSICNQVLQEFYRSSAKNHPMEDTHMEIPDRILDLEGILVTKQSAEQVRRILDAMPKRDRDLLRAIYLEEKEKDAICQEIGVDRAYLQMVVRRFKQAYQTKLVHSSEEAADAKEARTAEQVSTAKQEEPYHTTPPGTALYSIAEFICSKKTIDEIVRPLLADMQFEYIQALSAGRNWKATWVRARGCWSFFSALGINRIVRMFVRIFLRFSSR
jgi:RNA polymerase sigma-70 factor (ECF subfamily)